MGFEALEHYECDGQISLDDLEPAIKNKTLQAYLKRFGRDDLIDIIVVDHKRRLHYPVVTQHTVSDMGNPWIVGTWSIRICRTRWRLIFQRQTRI